MQHYTQPVTQIFGGVIWTFEIITFYVTRRSCYHPTPGPTPRHDKKLYFATTIGQPINNLSSKLIITCIELPPIPSPPPINTRITNQQGTTYLPHHRIKTTHTMWYDNKCPLLWILLLIHTATWFSNGYWMHFRKVCEINVTPISKSSGIRLREIWLLTLLCTWSCLSRKKQIIQTATVVKLHEVETSFGWYVKKTTGVLKSIILCVWCRSI